MFCFWYMITVLYYKMVSSSKALDSNKEKADPIPSSLGQSQPGCLKPLRSPSSPTSGPSMSQTVIDSSGAHLRMREGQTGFVGSTDQAPQVRHEHVRGKVGVRNSLRLAIRWCQSSLRLRQHTITTMTWNETTQTAI